MLATLGEAAGWFVAGGLLTVAGVALGLFARVLLADGARGWGTAVALVALLLLIVGLCVLAIGVPVAQCAPDAYECPV